MWLLDSVRQGRPAPATPPPKPAAPPAPAPTQDPRPAPSPAPAPVGPGSPTVSPINVPMPPVSNAPIQILGAWTALEVLNPQTFGKPHELASKGDRALVADISGSLPWERGEKSRPNKKLFFHVVLGTVDAPRAFEALLERFVDQRAERPRVKAEVVLASIIVDKSGVPVPDDAVTVSSFGWGLPVALNGSLADLSGWSAAAERLHADLAKQVRRQNKNGEELPLDRETIQEAFRWLLATLKLPEAYAHPPRFAIRVFQDFRLKEPPDPLLLNSFFLGDLARARACFANGTAPKALQLYVGQSAPPERRDLLQDVAALEEAIAPSITPPARWPAPGHHALVLLQQAAVNLALKDSSKPGIVAVNGPPGTGKTTLLRDIVAALVTRRAEAMCKFDDPSHAFSDSGQKLKLGSESATLYTLDRRLKGFEMLVASSNNGAVENVSAELPSQEAVADDVGVTYFKSLADALLDRPTWGLVAGVLGNAANRARFMKTFWWDEDLGLATYLAEAAGTPQWLEELGPNNTKRRRRPRLIIESNAPSSHGEALKRWRAARTEFLGCAEEARGLLAGLEAIRSAVRELPKLVAAVSSAVAQRDAALASADQARARFQESLPRIKAAEEELKRAQEQLEAHLVRKPGFIARLFRLAVARQWVKANEALEGKCQRATSTRDGCSQTTVRLEYEWKTSEATARKRAADVDSAEQQRAAMRRVLDEGRSRLGSRVVDIDFFERSHDVLQKSVPWSDDVAQRVRDNLFRSAIALHKAFIDAAAKPIRGNLAGLVKSMGPTGSSAFADGKAPLLSEVWATLFLVVPVISTTFASVDRMLGCLPSEALGWLLIDEAGQALPQAAVGAILRCRRAVVVGDPVQIEPVVPLPERLTQTICRRFGVDPDRFNAPEASAQTLADAATPYMAEFQGRQGSRTVGLPLLVHRRCAEPMFGIANAVAYQHLMVHAKTQKASAIKDCLGPSRWIDVRGSSRDKWCPEEGQVVLDLLRRLATAGVPPDVYIVSPFRMVEENLSRLLLESGVLVPLTPDPGKWVRERVGTVHTVQGREAEAVVFVLGAPDPAQRGARGWAGGRPNLLNVALTRAQEVAYVIGSRQLWRDAGVFGALHDGMPS